MEVKLQPLCECDEDGESWRSVKPLPLGLVGSSPATHTKERVRLVEGAVLKTVGCNRSGGSSPYLSADALGVVQVSDTRDGEEKYWCWLDKKLES